MKLNAKFSIVSAVASCMMATLVVSTIISIKRIQNVKDYQYLQQSVQLRLTDLTNFLNTTVSWALEPTTLHTEWQNKIVTLNKKFHELEDSPTVSYFPEEFSEYITEAGNIWTKLIGKVNPFNSLYKTMQGVPLSERELDFIRRNGIKAASDNFPDSENIKLLYSQQLLIHTQMRDIMKDCAMLQTTFTNMNEMLIERVNSYTKSCYIFIIVLGIVFCTILFIYILNSTFSLTHKIKYLQKFSISLAKKDFRNILEPHGTSELEELMININGMVKEINDFFVIVKKTASKAISSGYSINDSATSTAAATTQINSNIESITREFEQINDSVTTVVEAIEKINEQVKTLVSDNAEQTSAIDESTVAISTMANTLEEIRTNAQERTKNAEEMRVLVSDGDGKISATNAILNEVMSQLDEIGEVITIINSVSAKTNLLSMNAAIESAHAGEYGKGFAVVAEEIRSLAVSTAKNAQKINESISNVIEKVTQANHSSRSAAEAFAKVSTHSAAVIDSFTEITKGIENLDIQTKQITQKTDVTASTADKINNYCTNLAAQQETIASEINAISDFFTEAVGGIKEIKLGTADIVKRMAAVGDLSKQSYKNMTDLENVLEEFKTAGDDSESEKQDADSNVITNIISPELQAQLEQDFSQAEESGESTEQLDFALENIEEYDDNPAEISEEQLPEEETDGELEIPVVDEGEEI